MAADSNPSGFDFEIAGDSMKECECPICLLLIRDAMELPCHHIMCKGCLTYYEDTSYPNTRKSLCPLCKKQYNKAKKHKNVPFDKMIQTSLKIKCEQNRSGCVWTGCIADYNDHCNTCPYFVIKCPNEGCQWECPRNELDIKHDKECQYHKIPCQFCGMKLTENQIKKHHEKCEWFPVKCKNVGCAHLLRRNEVEKHCQEECDYEEVSCPYHHVGCHSKMRRIDIEDHNNISTQQHMMMLLGKLQKAENKIVTMEKSIKEKDEIIKRQEKSIADLETFSERVSDFHKTLSRTIISDEIVCPIDLNEERYNKDENVKEWKTLLPSDTNRNPNESCYLETLDDALENYSKVVLPSTYKGRYKQMVATMTTNTLKVYPFHDGNEDRYNFFYKLDNFGKENICVQGIYDDLKDFEEHLRTDNRWNRVSATVATFVDDDCVHVCFYTLDSILSNCSMEQRDVEARERLHLHTKTKTNASIFDFFIVVVLHY